MRSSIFVAKCMIFSWGSDSYGSDKDRTCSLKTGAGVLARAIRHTRNVSQFFSQTNELLVILGINLGFFSELDMSNMFYEY